MEFIIRFTYLLTMDISSFKLMLSDGDITKENSMNNFDVIHSFDNESFFYNDEMRKMKPTIHCEEEVCYH